MSRRGVTVVVTDGFVELGGEVRDGGLIPVAARLARAVAGVVGVACTLTGPPRAEDAAS
ncbi:BON domain-containing protein [Streptomyces sp. PmtA]|uniref:BON domain-containing protein n=1 Tax=Streptomyces sp. PmtA TaxID=3074275 RepID=UPI003014B529